MRGTAAACVVALLVTACGPWADDPLAETAAKLGEVRSGRMILRAVARTDTGDAAGFSISGPFSLPEDASLIEGKLAYRQIGDEASGPLVFTSTGDEAFVEVEGQAYELPAEQVAYLQGIDAPGDEGPFDALDFSAWASDVNVSAGPEIGGVATEVVRGRLDVAAAAKDLLGLAHDYGATEFATLEGEEAERLRRAVQSATIEVTTGAEDRFLRRLRLSIDLGASAPESLSPALEGLLGVEFRLVLVIRDPNSDVRVAPPDDALPYEALTG